MSDIPYVRDILSQVDSLEHAVGEFDAEPLGEVASQLKAGMYDRIVITGMGASYYAGYVVWLRLTRSGIPAVWIDTSELIHHAPALIGARTLLWMMSQSGRSAEITAALESTRLKPPGKLIAVVNDMDSPLAHSAAPRIPMYTEPEATVSTRTYVNALALGQLTAAALLGESADAARRELLETAAAMRAYLADCSALEQALAESLGFPSRMVLLGRGPSLCSAFAGALVLSEAAKYLATPFQAAEFRHGPLEAAHPELAALIFEGEASTRDLNFGLLNELRRIGAKAFCIGPTKQQWQLSIPDVPAIGLPLLEILPIQVLSVHFAKSIGIMPGVFFRIGKVTLKE